MNKSLDRQQVAFSLVFAALALLLLNGVAPLGSETRDGPCANLEKADCIDQMRRIFAERGSVDLLLFPIQRQRRPTDAHQRIEVIEGGAGDRAGIRSGDRLMGWNDKAMVSSNMAEFVRFHRSLEIGTEIRYQVERGGEEMEIQVTAAAPTPEHLVGLVARFVLESFGLEEYQAYLKKHGIRYEAPDGHQP